MPALPSPLRGVRRPRIALGFTAAWALVCAVLIPLASGAPSAAAATSIVLHGSATGNTGASSGTSSFVIPRPGAAVAGDLLLAQISGVNGSGTSTIAPAGWTKLDERSNANHVAEAIYWKVATAAEPASYSFGLSPAARGAGGIAAYGGVATSSPIDAWSAATDGSATTHVAPSVTATSAGDLLVVAMSGGGGPAFTFPSGMSPRWSVASASSTAYNIGAGAADQALATTGATGTRTVVASKSTSTTSHSIALRPSGTTPPPPPPPASDSLQASLKVSPSTGTTPLSVIADASASSDADATPIATYRFAFGDGAVIGPQAAATAGHTYTSTGVFTATVTVTDTAGNVQTASAQVTVSPAGTSGAVAVYAGYYDTHHPGYPQPKPSPWLGSSGVVFVGQADSSSGGWDTSAVRVANISGGTLSITVTVDIGSHHFALWGTRSVPAGYSLIVAQTAYANFDGSDFNPAGQWGADPSLCTTAVSATIPVVHVTVGSTTTNYYDRDQILNTNGVDSAGCPYTGSRNDESQAWARL